MCCTMRLCIYNVCLYTTRVYVLYSLSVHVCAWMHSAAYVLYAYNSIASVFYVCLYKCVHIHSSMCMFNAVCTHICSMCVFYILCTHICTFTLRVCSIHKCACTLYRIQCVVSIYHTQIHSVCVGTHTVYMVQCVHICSYYIHICL